MLPASAVFNTPNAGGNAQINNVNGDFINLNVYTVTPDRVHHLSITIPEEKIYQWLAAPDTSGNYNAAREKHHDSTGAWFLEGEEFVHWKETPGSALWINGTPGCGKTIICSIAIESVRQEYKPESGAACAFFFFDSRNAETDQSLHEKMLRSLIRQLSHQWGVWYKSRQPEQSPLSPKQVNVPAALMDIYGGGHETPSTAALQLTLQKIIADFDRTYIVIDALDECLDRHKLLAWIGSLVQRNISQLHILFSSRREQDILQRFEPMESICPVSLAGASTNADIERYVDDMLASIARWNAAIRARIKRSLMEGVDGMFRWVAFQIAELIKCLTPRDVDAQLRSLPKDLDGMYERTLTRSANPEQLKQLLIWLAFSVRHLLVEELAEVIAIDFSRKDTPAYDPDLRYFSPTDVLDLCAGFVTCVPISGWWIRSSLEYPDERIGSKGIVKLAHMSVKDYLVSERIKKGAASCFGINATLANTKITATCLAYLLHLGSHPCLSSTIFGHRPLAVYVVRNWLQHLGWGRSNEAPVRQLMNHMFSREHNALMICFRLEDPHRSSYWGNIHFSMGFTENGPPLYFASLIGLEEVVKDILNRGEDVQGRGGPCANALQAASYHGHEGVVRILLQHGANVNTRGGYYSNALRAAFYGHHINVARLLLLHKADANVREASECTLLQDAARHDDFAAAQLLLEHDVDVNAPAGYECGTALQNASRCGKYALVRLLLEHGADVNAPAGPQGTALQSASSLVISDVVRLLLEHGADVNAPAGPEGTALQAAISWPDPDEVRQSYSRRNPYLDLIKPNCTSREASRRSYAIVRLLIERGAEVNAPAGKGCLDRGNIYQGEGWVFSRLDRKIRPCVEDSGLAYPLPAGPKGTALQMASGRGDIDIVRLLLEYGADGNAPAGPKGTALQIASGRGDIDIVRLLLEYGADGNAPAGPKGTALQAVFNWAHPDQREYYGSRDRYPPSLVGTDEPDFTSLALQPSRRGYDIVRLLLEHGADVNAPAGYVHEGVEYKRTALQIATYHGEFDIVQLLVERGADVNAPAGPDDTVLQDAAYHGHLNSVQLLLEHGADINALAGSNGTALEIASSIWDIDMQHSEVVRLLMENGADVDTSNSAMLWASQVKNAAGVKVLLEHGVAMGPQEAEDFIFCEYKRENHAEILQLLLDSEAGVDKEWLYRKRVEWFREGRIRVEDYDCIELWGMSPWARSMVPEQDSDGEQWYTPDESSAPASPVQNTL
ncbi:hypothetical protein HWV62_13589 [Athelia sp. TMB]|nr:hypothetical protein HWV62_13589 [Athelia sp. TMB]